MSTLFHSIGEYKQQVSSFNSNKIINMAMNDYSHCHDFETIGIRREVILYCLRNLSYSLIENHVREVIDRLANLRETHLMNLDFERKVA